MLTRLIIISEIDPDKGTANLFMTRATDDLPQDFHPALIRAAAVVVG